jgi:hypothetical protein
MFMFRLQYYPIINIFFAQLYYTEELFASPAVDRVYILRLLSVVLSVIYRVKSLPANILCADLLPGDGVAVIYPIIIRLNAPDGD